MLKCSRPDKKELIKLDKQQIIKQLVPTKMSPISGTATAFAPANIALCKYWGKRDPILNLPHNSSLSISLGRKGVLTHISQHSSDEVILNQQPVPLDHPFAQRLLAFLRLIRPVPDLGLRIETSANIPIAAGVASSACGFAALVKALDQFFQWQLDDKSLSILARLGSGSACRSLWQGFVEWHCGTAKDGMDSYAQPLSAIWGDLRVGLLIISTQPKPISSSVAMQQTVNSSLFYPSWLTKVQQDLIKIKQAIQAQDFLQLGAAAESNALAMHALMQTTEPPVYYSLPATVNAMHTVWQARQEGLPLFFTQDAGPNIKLLFLAKDQASVCELFPTVDVINPFEDIN